MLRSPLLKRLIAEGKEAVAKPEREFEADGKPGAFRTGDGRGVTALAPCLAESPSTFSG